MLLSTHEPMHIRAVFALVLSVFVFSGALGASQRPLVFEREDRLVWQWINYPDSTSMAAERTMTRRRPVKASQRWTWEVLQALTKPGAVHSRWAEMRFAELKRAAPDSSSLAFLLWARAERWLSEGFPERALMDFEYSARLYAAQGNHEKVHLLGGRVGVCYRELGQWVKADERFDSSVDGLLALSDTLNAVFGLEQWAQLHMRRGHYAAGNTVLDRAEALLRSAQGSRVPGQRARLGLVRAELAFWSADFREALTQLKALRLSDHNPSDPDWQSRWEMLQGRMYRQMAGAPHRAKGHFRAALRWASERGAPRWVAPPSLELASLMLDLEQPDSASAALGRLRSSDFNTGMRGERLQWSLLEAELALIRRDFTELRARFQSEALTDTTDLDEYEHLTRALGRINLVLRLMEVDPWSHPPHPPGLKAKPVYLTEAEQAGRRALTRVQRTDFNLERAVLLEKLSQLLFLQGQGDSAYAYVMRSNQLRASLLDTELGASLEEMNLAVELERSQRALTLEVSKAEKARRRNWTLFGFSVLALAAVVATGIAYRRIRDLRRQSDALLDNILPKSIGIRLKTGQGALVEEVEQASLVFIDLVGFTAKSKKMSAEALSRFLEEFFEELDGMCSAFGLEKIKTIGDAYMAAAGVPLADPQHAIQAAEFALAVQENLCERGLPHRIGIDSGPLVAGVIGKHKFIYDLWGEVVNAAARMEQLAAPNTIRTTERFKTYLGAQTDGFGFDPHAPVEVKGLGTMTTYTLSRSAKSKALGG